MAGLASEVVRLQWVGRGRPVWFGGVGYPRGYQTLSRFTRCWTVLDPDCPDEAHAILEHVRQHFFADSWDPETHWVRMPTVPEPRPPGPPPSQAWAHYEKHLPNWEDGLALGVACRFRKRAALTAVVDMVQRARRRS